MSDPNSSEPENNNSPEQEDQQTDIDRANKSAQDWVKTYLYPVGKPLIRFAPIGYTSFHMMSLLLEHEWLNALINLPITIVSVIWIAISETILITFSKIYRERTEKDIYNLMTWIDETDKQFREAIQWKLAKPEEKYLTCQGNACTFYTTEGTANIFKPLLKDVFVPLELSGDFLSYNNSRRINS